MSLSRHIAAFRAAPLPRWVLAVTALVLALAIFIIVVHPYYDLSKSTQGEKSPLLALVFALAVIADVLRRRAMPRSCPVLAKPTPPLPNPERTCTRRI